MQGDVIRLRPDMATNKDGRVLVLIGEIANISARRRAERVESCPYVFHRKRARSKHYNWDFESHALLPEAPINPRTPKQFKHFSSCNMGLIGSIWEYIPQSLPHSSKSGLPHHTTKKSHTSPIAYLCVWEHERGSLRHRSLPGSFFQ